MKAKRQTKNTKLGTLEHAPGSLDECSCAVSPSLVSSDSVPNYIPLYAATVAYVIVDGRRYVLGGRDG